MTTLSTLSATSASIVVSLIPPTSVFDITHAPTPEPSSLTVFLHDRIEADDDFFPFHDLAKIGGYTKDEVTFQDLIQEGIDGGQQIVLFRSGCVVESGGSDCSKACLEPEHFFGSLDTFYNCAALSAISHWTNDRKTYYISEEAEKNASSIMGTGSLRAFNSKPVLQSFAICAKDSCANDHLSVVCDPLVPELSNTSSAEDIFKAIDVFCPSIPAEIDPDVFGPGVS